MSNDERSAATDFVLVQVRNRVLGLVFSKAAIVVLCAVGLVVFFAAAFGSFASSNQAGACGNPLTISQDGNNTEVAYKFLASDQELALQPFQAAAIVGNFIHESGGDPIVTDVVNYIGAVGIAQWYQEPHEVHGRRSALYEHAKSLGLPWTDLRAQLSFLKYELTVTRRGNLDALRRTTNIKDATEVFEATFEVSGDYSSYPKRVAHAESVLDRYGSTLRAKPILASACVASGSLGGSAEIDSSPGSLVQVPGFPNTRIDNRVLPNLLAMIKKYKIMPGDCYVTPATLGGHTINGEHPLGVGCDIYPDASKGGTWQMVDQLAAWAEPQQNQPHPAFRWVGYNGDANHGSGHHLHISWDHAPSAPFTVPAWVRVVS